MSVLAPSARDADLERRFGGLRRLYGDAGYRRIRAARLAIVGLGGVGSWAAEALARCGVARLTLIDLDHVAESNVNRQVHALDATLGQAKVLAMARRVAGIHPGCQVDAVDAFVEPAVWPVLLPAPVDVVIDACDDLQAKMAMAAWALSTGARLIVAGAAGGKRQAHRVMLADLVAVTHDPLLAALRSRLRRQGLLPAADGRGRVSASGLTCVYSPESVAIPDVQEEACQLDGSLNCQGYGSVVTVTASFGMVAADAALQVVLEAPGP